MKRFTLLVDVELKRRLVTAANRANHALTLEVTLALIAKLGPANKEALVSDARAHSCLRNNRAGVINDGGPETIMLNLSDELWAVVQEAATRNDRSVTREIVRCLKERYL